MNKIVLFELLQNKILSFCREQMVGIHGEDDIDDDRGGNNETLDRESRLGNDLDMSDGGSKKMTSPGKTDWDRLILI